MIDREHNVILRYKQGIPTALPDRLMFENLEIPIVLADDEKILRLGLKMTLERIQGVSVVGEATNGQEAIALVEKHRPVIVFMDIRMPELDGIQATKAIKRSVPETRVIMFTAIEDEESFRLGLQAGADAYCLKSASEQQLSSAIQAVLQGAKWLDSGLTATLMSKQKGKIANTELFSPIQHKILAFLEEGKELDVIATNLNLSIDSIKLQLRNIMNLLKDKESTQLLSHGPQPVEIQMDPEQMTRVTPLVHQAMPPAVPGNVFAGKYEILQKLGAGGMSTVFKARHIMMDKLYAIKMIHPHLATNKASVDRLQIEAQAAAAINHPAIVSVHDCDIDAQTGSPYLVMDYFEGNNLADMIKARGTMPIVAFIQIFMQVCDALSAFHTKGIVHRDVTPGNIMVAIDNNDDFHAKIVDLGIAKVLENVGSSLTKPGDVFGSPAYMSPEQCQGMRVDGRSDLYSLGCVMYKSLTGQVPFVSENSYHVICRHVEEPPSRLPFLRLDVDVPEEIQAIVFKLLSKSPDHRYQSALEVEDALRECLQDADIAGASRV